MAAFNPNMIVSAAKSAEFAGEANQDRTAKAILLDGIKRQLDFYANPTKEGRRWFVRGQKEVCITENSKVIAHIISHSIIKFPFANSRT